MRGQKRPQTERARAVGLAVVVGQEEAGRQLSIPTSTIHEWMNRPEFVELRNTAREKVGDLMWVSIQEGIRQLDDGLRNPNERLRDKSDTVQMLIEKRALLMGEATARTETHAITDGWNDEERDALKRAIDAELGKLSSPPSGVAEKLAVAPAGTNGSGPLPAPSEH